MSRAASHPIDRGPLTRRPLLAGVAYLGGIGSLAGQVFVNLLRPSRTLAAAACREVAELAGGALGIVLLTHFSIGSFLAMQSYFGATFREASGAVVGVGLVRNLATLLTGFTLAGVLASRVGQPIARDPAETAGRVLGATVAGPILSCWGAAIGFFSGMLVARSLLGVPAGLFLGKFAEMVETTDAVGILVKGTVFAAVASLAAEHESARGAIDAERGSGLRAAVLAIAAIVFLNGTWFSLAYLSGDPFGPVLELRR